MVRTYKKKIIQPLKKEGNFVKCYNINKRGRHYTKRNKPVTEEQLVHDSTCKIYLK